jgi:hypothetical protein
MSANTRLAKVPPTLPFLPVSALGALRRPPAERGTYRIQPPMSSAGEQMAPGGWPARGLLSGRPRFSSQRFSVVCPRRVPSLGRVSPTKDSALPSARRAGGAKFEPRVEVRGANRNPWDLRGRGGPGLSARALRARSTAHLPCPSRAQRPAPCLTPRPGTAPPLRRRCAVAAPAGSRRSAPDVVAGGSCRGGPPALFWHSA